MSITTKTTAPIAPWAEAVPGAPPHMTVDDLLEWPDDDGYRYELVEWVLVRVEVTGAAQRQNQMDAKARRYLSAGTALVWVAWPEKRAIERDEEAVKHWKRRTWPALKKKPSGKAV